MLHVYKLECLNENDTRFFKNVACELKSKTRGVSSMTIVTDIQQDIDYFMLNMEVMIKSSSNSFNSVIVNTSVELCGALADLPPALKLIVPLMDYYGRGMIHKCPYRSTETDLGVRDLTLDTRLIPVIVLSTIDRGDYRAFVNWKYKDGTFIFWIKVYFSIVQKRFQKKKTTTEVTPTEP
jgi:hypothetical protein